MTVWRKSSARCELLLILLVWIIGTGGFALSARGSDATIFPGFTKPSEQRDVTFNGPGVVSEEPVKEGDQVQAGQLLAVQDSTVEEAHLKVAQVEANSDLQVEGAEADHAAKQVELKRKQQMRKDRVVGESEVEEAQVNEVIAAIRIKLAAQEKAKAVAEVAEEMAKIKLRRLVSPVGGVISKVNTHVGEATSSESSKPIMTVIENDPLYVEVELPTAVVKSVQTQQSLAVRYIGEDQWLTASVIFVAPEADARSDRQKVRLQLDNKSKRASGLQVQVKVSDKIASIAQ